MLAVSGKDDTAQTHSDIEEGKGRVYVGRLKKKKLYKVSDVLHFSITDNPDSRIRSEHTIVLAEILLHA